jgi:hypothetical protein
MASSRRRVPTARRHPRAVATFYGGHARGFRDFDGHVWEVAHGSGIAFAMSLLAVIAEARPRDGVAVADASPPASTPASSMP